MSNTKKIADPFFEPMKDGPVAIAHQTNTPSQIESASRIMTGYSLPSYVEIDVLTNIDGTPMAVHPASPNPRRRYRKGWGAVPPKHVLHSMTDKDLKSYNSHNPGKQISTLEEILNEFPNVRFVLHLKDSQPEALANVLTSTNSFANVCAGAMRGSTLRDLESVLHNIDKRIAMFVALTDTALIAPKAGMIKKFENPEIARQHWEGLGYATGWNALPVTTPRMVADAQRILNIPIITTNEFPKFKETPEFFDRQYEKGFDAVMADDVTDLALAAVKRREKLS